MGRPTTPRYRAAGRRRRAATAFGGVAWLSDGLGGDGVAAFARCARRRSVNGPIVAYADDSADLVGLKPPVGTADALTVPVDPPRRRRRRPAGSSAPATSRAASSAKRRSTSAPAHATTEAKFTLPVELRNDIARLEIAGAETAGAVQLLDDRWRRRRIGLLSGASAEAAQPLLSPLYYISRAVQPFADVREPREANAAVAVPD